MAGEDKRRTLALARLISRRVKSLKRTKNQMSSDATRFCSPSPPGFHTTSTMRRETESTDRLQNFNLISGGHFYRDTNQATALPLSGLIKAASQLEGEVGRLEKKYK